MEPKVLSEYGNYTWRAGPRIPTVCACVDFRSAREACPNSNRRSADKCKEMKTQVSRDKRIITLYKFVFAALSSLFIAVLSFS